MTRPAPTSAGLRALVALLGLVTLLLVGTLPAAAVDEVTLVRPAPGGVVDGPFTIIVLVDASDGELIERVEAQLAGPSNRSWDLVADGPPDLQGVQRWVRDVDPLAAGDVLRNGAHRLVVRPTPAAGDPPPFQGHDVTLSVGVRTPLSARPTGEDPTVVALSWDPVQLPDFLGYRLQRRPDADGGAWTTIAELSTASTRDATDVVPEPGAYRYRLLVVRSDGGTGEVVGASAPRGVRADPANPGTFDPPPEDDEPAAPSTPPSDAPADGASGPVPRPGSVAQADPGPPQTGTATTPTLGQPQVTVGQPPAPPPPSRPTPPTVVPLDDGVFEPLLPVEETEGQVTITETETAFLDAESRPGGSLAVLTEEPPDRDVVMATAAGLLLIVIAAHVRRFLGDGQRG